ncbi:MAG: SpoIIE family protein phosphatase, partial [Rhodobacteraceae bacterium]|nr:SpoIIE family protein phosphatase [Paracoccaceae bacterium]
MPDGGIAPDTADLLRTRQPLFEGATRDQIVGILGRCEVRSLDPGDTILSPGEPNENLYLLLDGQLRVHLDAAGSSTSFSVDPGQCVGEVSLIDGGPASAYVVAARPSRLLCVPGDVFWDDLIAVPEIARNLTRMVVRRLRDRAETILRAQRQQLRYEALKKELDAARTIQMSMLTAVSPLCQTFPALDLHALMDPAKDVGGDFYDALALDDRSVLLTVGDVAGKGMPAALFMVRAMTVLRMAALRGDPTDDLLGRVNALLCENNPSATFTTVFAAVLDARTGGMTYFNGGHPAPLLSRAGGPFEPLPVPRGPIVGAIEGIRYQAATVRLVPGDRLVAYTDGVTEAEDAQGGMFGEDRIRE